ncbi:hypothetical protein B0H11DRAFT_2269294 [Mycena galericulata]|nr:hypothetical protein B0H11DRAFT_2269294 [Mycena galericulata]
MALRACLQILVSPLRQRTLFLLIGVLVLALPILLLQERAYARGIPLPTQINGHSRNLPPSQVLFPADPAPDDRSWIAENSRTTRALLRCIERANCAQNQTKVVILAASPFRELLVGANGGEAVWANSTLLALQRLGYSYIYSTNMERMSQLYYMFRTLVAAVIVDATDSHACFQDENCILKRDRPYGIPAWKILSFHFWDSPDHPLGRKWTLSPEDYRGPEEGNTYLGYSIEPQCSTQTFIPHAHRKRQAYVLAKESTYFIPETRAYDPDAFGAAAAAADIGFLAGVRDPILPVYFPPNVTNAGFMTPAKFRQTLAESRVLIGIGRPFLSPTPYEALCLGVPFINPILEWNADDPADRTQWSSQHGMLHLLDPPYVYNVFKGDTAGFVHAGVAAMAHPIESFVVERMRMHSVEARLAAILATDWKAEAARLLAQREAAGSGETFWL